MKQRRDIRRMIARASVFLLLGAIVNVAVAWGFALSPSSFAPDWIEPGGKTLWQNYRPHDRGHGEYTELRLSRTGYRISVLAVGTGAHSVEDYHCVVIAGWPSAAVDADSDGKWNPQTGEQFKPTPSLRPGLRTDLALIAIPFRPLPLRPLWPGFAINTLFYGAILWLLSAAPFALRRRRRIKRGLCPKCAYPVGASPICTECGKPVAKHKAQTQKAEIS